MLSVISASTIFVGVAIARGKNERDIEALEPMSPLGRESPHDFSGSAVHVRSQHSMMLLTQ